MLGDADKHWRSSAPNCGGCAGAPTGADIEEGIRQFVADVASKPASKSGRTRQKTHAKLYIFADRLLRTQAGRSHHLWLVQSDRRRLGVEDAASITSSTSCCHDSMKSCLC